MVYLRHMVDAIELIESYVGNKSYEEFRGDRMLQDAVIREMEILGEAAKNLSKEFKERHPDVPWRSIAGMKDKLIHQYFGVDLEAVWNTVIKDLPVLKENLMKILKS